MSTSHTGHVSKSHRHAQSSSRHVSKSSMYFIIHNKETIANRESTFDKLSVAFNKTYRGVLSPPVGGNASAMYANFGMDLHND